MTEVYSLSCEPFDGYTQYEHDSKITVCVEKVTNDNQLLVCDIEKLINVLQNKRIKCESRTNKTILAKQILSLVQLNTNQVSYCLF